jgi:hypothetical protein
MVEPLFLLGFLVAACMSAENAGGSELAELMTDQVLGYVHGNQVLPLYTEIVCPTISGMRWKSWNRS